MRVRNLGGLVAIVLGAVVAAYFMVRAVIEFFVVDFGDPSRYQDAWGGPTLFECWPCIVRTRPHLRGDRRRSRGPPDQAVAPYESATMSTQQSP